MRLFKSKDMKNIKSLITFDKKTNALYIKFLNKKVKENWSTNYVYSTMINIDKDGKAIGIEILFKERNVF